MGTLQRHHQACMSPSQRESASPDHKLPSHPYNLRPRSITPAQPTTRKRVIRKTSVLIHADEVKSSEMDGVDLDPSKRVDSDLSQCNGHRTPQQLSLMLIIIITSTITLLFGIYAGQHGPSVSHPTSAFDPSASGLGETEPRASNSSPNRLLFDIHQPIVHLTTTIKTVPGFVTEVKQSLDYYQGNLSSAVNIPKRWAEACRGGSDPWRNWWDSPACDVGFAEYGKAERADIDDLLSMIRDLEGELRLLHPSMTTNWYTFQFLESILDTCIRELGKGMDRPPRDIAKLYYGALDIHTDTTFEMHRMVRSSHISLHRAHQSLDRVNELTVKLGEFLQQRLGIESDSYRIATAELKWASQLLFHLEEQIRRISDELEAWEIVVKTLEGSEEYGFLNLETVISIAMGNRSIANEGVIGRAWVGWDKEMLEYDFQLPSEDEQYIALLLARRGLRPLYLE